MKVLTFDTTPPDGKQGEGISLSVDDKLAIAASWINSASTTSKEDPSVLALAAAGTPAVCIFGKSWLCASALTTTFA